MTKKIIYFLLFNAVVLSQDSLYWFNFNLLDKNIPKTSKVLDQVFKNSQFMILDSLVNINNLIKEGYRLQIYDAITVAEANKTLKDYRKKLSDSLYIVFEAPFYKVRYGNYISKKVAEIEKKRLMKQGFKNIWIVKSRIEGKAEYFQK